MAKAVGRALPISTKSSVEVCNFIRNKSLQDVKKILEAVIKEKKAIPFRIYNSDRGHKKSIGPGRYPKKIARELLKLVNAVEANAQFKGLDTSSLFISHICPQRAGKTWRFGRQRRRVMKKTNIEIMIKEKAKKPKETKKKK